MHSIYKWNSLIFYFLGRWSSCKHIMHFVYTDKQRKLEPSWLSFKACCLSCRRWYVSTFIHHDLLTNTKYMHVYIYVHIIIIHYKVISCLLLSVFIGTCVYTCMYVMCLCGSCVGEWSKSRGRSGQRDDGANQRCDGANQTSKRQ